MQNKLLTLQKHLQEKNLDALIVSNCTNIFYLCGFKGISQVEREALLIVLPKKATLVTARLYQNEAQKLASGNLKIVITEERAQIEQAIHDTLKKSSKVGFEETDLKFSEFKNYRKILRGKKLIPVINLIEKLREIKSQEELENIEKAQKLTCSVFEEVIKTLKAGQTEAQIKDTLEKIAKEKSREPLAFDPIIASGPNSSIPHYVTGSRKLQKGDALLFDFGLKFKSYCADFSRTIFIGKANDQQKNIYSQVVIAQKAAIANIKEGSKAKDVYNISLDIFKTNSLEDKFIHSLGHGIGLEVHEKPSLYKTSKDILKSGMVFSVEPGLYFKWGGVRIEDLVTIKNNKGTILGKGAKFIEIA